MKKDGNDLGSPVVVLLSSLWANKTFLVDYNEKTEDIIPISTDDYKGTPLAGSELFVDMHLSKSHVKTLP